MANYWQGGKVTGREVNFAFRAEPGTRIVRIGDVHLPERFMAQATLPAEGLAVTLGLVLEDGHPVADMVQVERFAGQPAITKSTLRTVEVEELTWLATMNVTHYVAQELGEHPGSTWPDVVAGSLTARRPHRLTDDHLREVAEVYKRAVTDGEAVTAAVVEHFGGEDVLPVDTASKWIKRARERGFLPKTKRGRVKA